MSDIERAKETALAQMENGLDAAEACEVAASRHDVALREVDDAVMAELSDHWGREPEDTEEADAVLREALGEDYDL